jgi:tetratricopeptide (TPR) repeat protein
MTETPVFNFDADPGPALAELCRLLRFSQGEFTLIVAVCNATEHRQVLVDQLRQTCPIPFEELTLAPEADTLFTTLHQAVGNPPPTALMVYGLDAVQDLESLLLATNQVREEFRQLSFPLVLWLTDYGQRHLIRTAPDFYTWANTVSFPTPTNYFQRFLDELITSVWQQVITSQENRFLSTTELGLSPNSPRCRELETSLTALNQAGVDLTPSQSASLAFVRGRIADNNTDEARYHYEDSLAQWQALARSPSPLPHSLENVGHLQFYLGLWWRNRSVRDRRQFEPACQTACDYFAATIATLTQAQCPEAVAKYINYWAEALHRLEQWDTLDRVAQQALTLHQSRQDSLRQARALGFLAEVALHSQDWLQAETQAQTALHLISAPTSTPDPTFLAWVNRFHRSWYLFSLGKAQFAQQHIEAAVSTLEQAIDTTQPEYDPQLYSQVLDQLGQAYFQQGRYLEAFQTRRRKEAIESRFNFRAFVGAGRLQPKQAVANPALPTHTLDRDAIVASGRKHDVQRLVYRLLQDGFTFTVIYGPSGVGKSSLLEAGLVPALEQEHWEGRRVLPLRCGHYGNWAEDLLAQLGHDAGHSQPAEAVLDRIRLQTQRNRVVVMIFDQFEEFFFEYDQPASRRSFYQFLGQSLATPFVKVVLSLREDYVHYLLECQRLIDLAIIDDNILDKKWLYYLGNFTPAEATTVITDLTEPTPYAPAADLVEQVVAELAEETGEVRPIELQIVGAQLQAENITTLAAYQGRGPNTKATLVQQYLTDVVTQCGPVEHQRLAELMLYLLTDEKGTRPRKTKANLAQDIQTLTHQASLDDGTFTLVLDILTQSGLVIHVPEAPEDRYQLVHDYLAAFIHQQQAPRLKAVMAELEQEKRQRQQAEAEKAELAVANRKARRRLLLSSGLLVASILGTVVAVPSAISALRVAQVERTNAAAEQAKANDERAKADQAQKEAVVALQGAEQARTAQVDADRAKQEANKLAKAAENRQKEAEQAAAQAQKDAQAAQSAVETAQAAEGIALSEQQAAQRQAEEAQRQANDAEQLRQTATVEAEAARTLAADARRQQEVARAGTQLEQQGNSILRLDDTRLSQAEALIEALQLGYALKAQLPEANAKSDQRTLENYPAYSPLLALRVTTHALAERGSYEGAFRGFTPDEQGLVTYSYSDGKSRLWSLSGTEQASYEGAFRGFTPDEQGLVTYSSSDGKSRLWSLSGTEQASYEGEFLGFTPDEQGLVTVSSSDGKSRLWSLSGTEQASYEGAFLGFTPDEQGLVTYSSSDGKSRLWSLSGTEQASYEGAFRGFTPDEQGLYTDTDYGTTMLWSRSGERLVEFTGRLTTNAEARFGRRLTRFSDDGQYLITSLDDTTHQIWQLDNGLDDLLARGCNLLASHFRANPGKREELGICLDQPL